MSKGVAKASQARRAVRAVLVVAALIALVPISDFLGSAFRAGDIAVETVAAAQDACRPFDVGEVLGDEATYGGVSASFEEETFSFASFRDVRCSADGAVVSFAMEEPPDQAMCLMRDWLGQSGWSCQDSGISTMASFSKSEGHYRWLFASCLPEGAGTNVVMQGIRQYEGEEIRG